MQPPFSLLLSTAYAPPVSYFTKLYHVGEGLVGIEAEENYIKQTYRNRCHILSPNGLQALTIPIEQSPSLKTPIREVRISEHGSWRHLHLQALSTAYGSSSFYEYYIDDLLPIYERGYRYLWDFNEALFTQLLRLLHLEVSRQATETFTPLGSHPEDWRYGLRPKHPEPNPTFVPRPYHQVYRDRFGFVPDLSILDLLFDMGPEALLILRDSYVCPTIP